MGRYTGKSCRLIVMISLTVVFFIAEVVAGYIGNSIALVSDSFNMLSDLLSLSVGLAAGRLSRRARTSRCTYGLSRAEVVGALANAVFLAALCFSISVQALNRLAFPEPISDPQLVLIVGSLGLMVNLIGLLIFQDYSCCRTDPRERKKAGEGEGATGEAGAKVLDVEAYEEEEQEPEKPSQPLNIRGVLLHVLNDALGSVVVVVSSALFYIRPLEGEKSCNWQCYVDPSLTLFMVLVIMSSAVPLFKETITILLQMSPPDFKLKPLLEIVSRIPEVQGIHEVHVWELARKRIIATIHVKCTNPEAYRELSHQVRKAFHMAGVHSVTIQPEFTEDDKSFEQCSALCMSPSCQELSCCLEKDKLHQPQANGSLVPSSPSQHETCKEDKIDDEHKSTKF